VERWQENAETIIQQMKDSNSPATAGWPTMAKADPNLKLNE